MNLIFAPEDDGPPALTPSRHKAHHASARVEYASVDFDMMYKLVIVVLLRGGSCFVDAGTSTASVEKREAGVKMTGRFAGPKCA